MAEGIHYRVEIVSAFRRKLHRAVGADEQRLAEVLFQKTYLAGNSGLGDIEFLGRARETLKPPGGLKGD